MNYFLVNIAGVFNVHFQAVFCVDTWCVISISLAQICFQMLLNYFLTSQMVVWRDY